MANITTDNKFVTAGGLKTVVEHLQDDIQEKLDGKANSGHGTHVTYATTAPKANGTAAVGTSDKVAREDHVHPLQNSVSGNAGSANKVNNNLVVKLNGGATEGTNLFTFNGSAGKNINITPDGIGAAKASHGNHVPTTQTANARTFLRNDNTWQSLPTASTSATGIVQLSSATNSTSETVAATAKAVKAAYDLAAARPTLGTTANNAFYGDKGQTAYNHSQAAHAPSNAQKNSDITKAEIEAKLTGTISSHAHDFLEIKGTDTIKKVADDTIANWGAQKTSLHWYTTAGQITDQPAQWGYLMNFGKENEVHQLWMTQSSGDMRHRGGNASGWSGTWRTLLDTSNFKTHVTPSAIGASASGHTHDDRYFTESEMNTKLSTTLSDAKTYADQKITALVDSAPDAMNTLNELATAINSNKGVYDAYVEEMATKLAGKAPTSHASSNTTYGVSSASNYGHAKASGTTPKANTGTSGSLGNETSSFARGDHAHPLQTTVSGNAGTATKLQTARTINGTSFDGSANITTANWGTARTITIGATGKSVNGSGNVSWSRDEIGFITDTEVTNSLTSVFGASYIPAS